MKYIITYTSNQHSWLAVDSIIIEAQGHEEAERNLATALMACGWKQKDAEWVLKTGQYYTRSCEDLDYTVPNK